MAVGVFSPPRPAVRLDVPRAFRVSPTVFPGRAPIGLLRRKRQRPAFDKWRKKYWKERLKEPELPPAALEVWH